MTRFLVASITPAELAHPGLAVAASRAGGVGILDMQTCKKSDECRVADNLDRLLELTSSEQWIGLRVPAVSLDHWSSLLSLLRGRRHWIVLSGWRRVAQERLADAVADGARVWLEVTERGASPPPSVRFHGYLAKGSESGGWTGRESAFVLAQWAATAGRPFVVQGGIGLHSAAACRLAGAAGVVLDDQLLAMRETPLGPAGLAMLRRQTTRDTTLLQSSEGPPCRIAFRVDLVAAKSLSERVAALDLSPATDREPAVERRKLIDSKLGWGNTERSVWPLGQAAGLATELARRYRSVGRLIRAITEGTEQCLEDARAQPLLAAGGALSRSHRTRFPIVQGPMTRVSDRPEFAAAVADAGGLPFMALALMRGPEIRALLTRTAKVLGDWPWGIGVLGFVPPKLREEQFEAAAALEPPFALIAGGRPDQARWLEDRGVPTYLHTPSPELLQLFLDQGSRRFVFEGSECGGHVGPLSSFTLWNVMAEQLLEATAGGDASDVHVLLAGGIHDARSAAMASVIFSALAARGAKIGVLMGTAYLFTVEAVETGAIVQAFQQRALDSDETVTLVSAPGHAIRCARTPFTDSFAASASEQRRAQKPALEISESLDRLTVGRARVASKGLSRNQKGELVEVVGDEQSSLGMYMMGEVAGLRRSVSSIEALHQDVSLGSTAIFEALNPTEASSSVVDDATTKPVAVVGVACHLPGAVGLNQLWRNLLDRRSAITEVPESRWDWRLFFDDDRDAPDKIYSKVGGFLDEAEFDPVGFGIPPANLGSIAPTQLMALELTRRCLADAEYGEGGFDAERTAVIFGVANPGDLQHLFVTRSMRPLADALPDEVVSERLPAWTEATFAGVLDNVVAGRVANHFGFGGRNFTVDAACASSLAALDLAVQELDSGRSDVVLTGGIELEMSPYTFLCFSKTGALSPTGAARVFDQDADGIVIAEGAVVVMLKRLEDAERDGDRIYGVIRGVAGSSDGKGVGITAPASTGQQLALRRAWSSAALPMSSLEMYEAHGTGTQLGDRVELETLSRMLLDAGAEPRQCAIGSTKGLLGHTRAAAGMTGLVKALLAIYYKTLPPHSSVERPLAALVDPTAPMFLLDGATAWLSPTHGPRRAGVSAFGFGGTNFHAVVEEYRGSAEPTPLGADCWPHELFVLGAKSRSDLRERVSQLAAELDTARAQRPSLEALARRCLGRHEARALAAFVASDHDELRTTLSLLSSALDSDSVTLPSHVCLRLEDESPTGAIGFVFPGQGSQYPGMCREAAIYLPELRAAAELADGLVGESCPEDRLSQLIWPAADHGRRDLETHRERLADTRVAQPALAVVSCGLLDFIRRLGVRAHRVAGHSYGEYVALHAANVMTRGTLMTLSSARGRAMAAAASRGEPGGMAAVAMGATELRPQLSGHDKVTIANSNSPDQCVLSGPVHALENALTELEGRGITSRQLPVSCAFHSPQMAGASGALAAAIKEAVLSPPAIPVHGNLDGQPFPEALPELRVRMTEQLENPVDFVAQIEAMYAAGVRTFIELGPKRVLTNLVGQILRERAHHAVALDSGQGDLREVLTGLAGLIAAGVELDVDALFEGRDRRRDDIEAYDADPIHRARQYRLDGAGVRHIDQPVRHPGRMPLVNDEIRRQAMQQLATVADTSIPPSELAASEASAGSKGETALAVYQTYQSSMRHFLEMQEAVTTRFLEQFGRRPPGFGHDPSTDRSWNGQKITAGALEPSRNESDSIQVREPALETVDGPAVVIDRSAVSTMLIEAVSRQTGYPNDLLRLDADMESELGIDSMMRIQIFTVLQQTLQSATGHQLENLLDKLVDSRNLHSVIETVLERLPTGLQRLESRVAIGTTEVTPTSAAEEASSCPRYVMTKHVEPLRPEESARKNGQFIVVGDRGGVAERTIAQLRGRGVRASLVDREVLEDPNLIDDRMMVLSVVHGAVRGVIHLAPLDAEDEESYDSWVAATTAQNHGFFRVLQCIANHLEQATPDKPVTVLVASAMGGAFGRGPAPTSVAGGGCTGILRTLEAEYAHVYGKALDFATAIDPDEKAAHIVNEALAPGGNVEAGYDGVHRLEFRPRSAELSLRPVDEDWRPREGWVVLVTGGTRGITARIARELARSDVRLVVVGRSQCEGWAEGTVSEPDKAAIRKEEIGKPSHGDGDPKPAEIEARVVERFRQQERRYNLSELLRLGAEVDYHALDVSDASALTELIEGIYETYGRLDAVVHGAGIVNDSVLVEKTTSDFERVFRTKVDSTWALARSLRPEGLAWVSLFSSTAGRFGNQGQWDYAAANEMMNRLGWQMQAAWPDSHVVSINWGPWRGGMADQALQERFESLGIDPIDVEHGVAFFVRELSMGIADEVEVVAGEGPWGALSDSALDTVLELISISLKVEALQATSRGSG